MEERASGTVTIYNEYSTKSQRLITNTRFESPQGLVYRIKSPTVVPGYTTKGNTKIPGEIQVTVYADEPGEKYNDAETTFVLPGLKGSPQFEHIYAKSTSALSGGFVGEKAIVDEKVRSDTLAALKQEAAAAVRSSLAESVRSGDVLFLGTETVTFTEQPDTVDQDGALVSVTAVARAPVFDGGKLASVLATEGAVAYDGPLHIESSEKLTVEVVPSSTKGNLTITLSGDAELVGIYNKEQLLSDLAGKDRRSVGITLSGYPAIADMNISVYPFWRGRLPSDTGKITLTENGEAQ